MTFKRWVLLGILILAMGGFYYRRQIYVRDFRATVTRDSLAEDGAQVFFNLNDDILLENDDTPMYITLLQHERPVREPKQLNCIHFFVCLVAEDGAIIAGSEDGARLLSMSSLGATYRDSDGKIVTIAFH